MRVCGETAGGQHPAPELCPAGGFGLPRVPVPWRMLCTGDVGQPQSHRSCSQSGAGKTRSPQMPGGPALSPCRASKGVPVPLHDGPGGLSGPVPAVTGAAELPGRALLMKAAALLLAAPAGGRCHLLLVRALASLMRCRVTGDGPPSVAGPINLGQSFPRWPG